MMTSDGADKKQVYIVQKSNNIWDQVNDLGSEKLHFQVKDNAADWSNLLHQILTTHIVKVIHKTGNFVQPTGDSPALQAGPTSSASYTFSNVLHAQNWCSSLDPCI